MAEGEEQRYEFHFNKMQLIMIAGGIFILAGVMFALGMIVGRSVAEINTIVAQPAKGDAPASQPAPAQGTPAPAEHQLPAAAEQPAPAASAPTSAQHEAPAPVTAKAEPPAQEKPQPQVDRPVIQPLPTPPVELPEPTIMQTQTPQSMKPSQPSAKEAVTKSEPAAAATTKTEGEPKKTVSKARKSKTAAASQPSSSQKYMLQAASFSDRAEAENLVQTLKKRAVRATVVPIDIEGKGTWYRVRTGPYRSREEAEKYVEKLQKINGLGLTPMLIAAD